MIKLIATCMIRTFEQINFDFHMCRQFHYAIDSDKKRHPNWLIEKNASEDFGLCQ